MPKPSDPSEPRIRFLLFWLSFFLGLNLNGQPPVRTRAEGREIDGLREGEWRFFYPDGRLMALEHYRHGSLEGWAETFYPSGKLNTREFWREDVLEDSAFYYHENGSLYRKGCYVNGQYAGAWLTFSDRGVRVQEGHYRNGLPDGCFINWNDEGHLIEEGWYREGKKDGSFYYFNGKARSRLLGTGQFRSDTAVGYRILFNRRSVISRMEKQTGNSIVLPNR